MLGSMISCGVMVKFGLMNSLEIGVDFLWSWGWGWGWYSYWMIRKSMFIYWFIKDATPGPGYYHNEKTLSSIRSVGKPDRYQYFGSC